MKEERIEEIISTMLKHATVEDEGRIHAFLDKYEFLNGGDDAVKDGLLDFMDYLGDYRDSICIVRRIMFVDVDLPLDTLIGLTAGLCDCDNLFYSDGVDLDIPTLLKYPIRLYKADDQGGVSVINLTPVEMIKEGYILPVDDSPVGRWCVGNAAILLARMSIKADWVFYESLAPLDYVHTLAPDVPVGDYTTIRDVYFTAYKVSRGRALDSDDITFMDLLFDPKIRAANVGSGVVG